MTRIKGGPYGHLRHKKILKITKGQRGAKHFLFKRANEAMLKSLWYSTRDRRTRKRDLRKLWIARINAAARLNGTNVQSSGVGDEESRHYPQPQDAGRYCRPRSERLRGGGGKKRNDFVGHA